MIHQRREKLSIDFKGERLTWFGIRDWPSSLANKFRPPSFIANDIPGMLNSQDERKPELGHIFDQNIRIFGWSVMDLLVSPSKIAAGRSHVVSIAYKLAWYHQRSTYFNLCTRNNYVFISQLGLTNFGSMKMGRIFFAEIDPILQYSSRSTNINHSSFGSLFFARLYQPLWPIPPF